MLTIAPAIHHTDGVWVNSGRNEKGIKHIKRFHAFPEKLQLIQVSHILGLNVLILVG